MTGRRFDRVPPGLAEVIEDVKRQYHSRLLEPQVLQSVSVESFLVYGPRNKEGIQTGPAIQVHGRDAYACVRITKLEERVAGRADAVIWIDGDNVKQWPEEMLVALIDHELTHLELVVDEKTGEIVLDDAMRVKIKIRPHDFQVGWFDEVAQRHPEYSIETMQAVRLAEVRQMYFPGFEFKKLAKKRRA